MSTIKEYMTADHKQCDDRFAAAETAVSNGDWDAGETEFKAFRNAMEQHFDMEEGVLFPEFEQATGMQGGPTAVMRSEHDEIRRLLEQMTMALDARYQEEYLDASETLLVMMQQHNMKEEQMLYELADRQLGERSTELIQQMRTQAGA